MQKNIKRFIICIFALIILIWILIAGAMIWMANQVSKQDFSHGVKPVVESVWCGKPGCADEQSTEESK